MGASGTSSARGEFASIDDANGALHMIQSMGGAEAIVVKHRLPRT